MKKILIILFALCVPLAVTQQAYAAPSLQTLTILGANGVKGDVDPYTEFSLDGGATWHQAFLTGGHPWGFLPGTNSWINFDPDNTVGINSTTLYRVRFNVPIGATNPTANIQIKADNAADISLNGTFVQHIIGQGSANADLAFAGTVHPGLNEITISLIDWGGIVGFNYRVDLTVQAASPLTIAPASSTPANGAASGLKSDLVIGKAGEFGHYGGMGMLFNDGAGGFRLDAIGIRSFSGFEVAVGDLNKDGKDDVVVVSSIGLVSVALNGSFADGLQNSDLVPAGNFSEIAPNCCNRTRVLQLGDLNNDGNLDIAVVQWTKIGVMLGNGDGTFGSEIKSPGGLDARGMALGDVDGDGKLDLVATNAAGRWSTSVFLGNGDGTFQRGFGIPTSALGIPNIFLRDADGDGDLDLYTGALGSKLKIFSNDGSGNFTLTTDLEPGPGQGILLIVDDLNGDGTPDAVVATDLNGFTNVRVWLSDGNGGFVSTDYGPVGSLPRQGTLADINGDGIADIAMVTINIFGGNPGSLWTMLGNGDGTFQAPTSPIATYRNNWTIAAGNFSAPAVAPTNQAPIANAGADQVLECTGGSSAMATLNGSASFDPDGDPLTYSWAGSFGTVAGVTTAQSFALGLNTATLTVDDGNGGTASDSLLITVQDTIPPTVNAGADATVEATGPAGANFDISAQATYSDSCNGMLQVSISPIGPYTIGATTVTVTATDGSGHSASDTVVVNVVDTTAPAVTATLVPTELDEDEGKFRIEFSATDIVDPNPAISATLNGATVTNGQVVELERKKKAKAKFDDGELEISGLSFTLAVVATDQSGNSGSASAFYAFPDRDNDDKDKDKDKDKDDDDKDHKKKKEKKDRD